MTQPSPIEQAIAALRAGRPVRIEGSWPLSILSVETATRAMVDLLDPGGTAQLLLSGERAAALGLANELDAADPHRPVQIERPAWLDFASVHALADAALDFARTPLGPLSTRAPANVGSAQAALILARLAGVLPALWLIDRPEIAASVQSHDLLDQERLARAVVIARAELPLDGLAGCQMIAFRAPDDGQEHVALMVGAPGGQPPLVRLHSECLTGDVFGSLKCDCGPQLREALRLIGAAGSGILLYLRQEGRGIGLANKLRAYQLQDRGLDTVEANRRLGFPDDVRNFTLAAAMLRGLGIEAVRLLTNNPAKVRGLEGAGITVVERVSHHLPTNPHNADYIATKRVKSGHLD